jgi:uncharacterized protein (TIGR02145 family)
MRPWLERWASRRAGPGGPSIRDPRDGNDYPVVRIDSLDWLGRNLAFDAPASDCYHGDSTACATAGRLYDWTTALRACPAGWRLPTDTEWAALESALGMPPAALLAEGPRGSDQGTALQAGGRSRLNLPIAGYRRPSGEYVRRSERAAFWTASVANDDDAWHRDVRPDVGTIYRSPVTKTYKLSVRCVR